MSSMMNTLHAGNVEEQLRLTRIKFFSLFVGLSAVYYFIPGKWLMHRPRLEIAVNFSSFYL